jgi:GlpG protein
VRAAPPLAKFPAFPVISGVCLLAIFVTVAIRTGHTSIEPFTTSSLAFDGQPWRLVSSTLPHGDWLHLAFNVYWMWVLGTKLEETLGPVTTFVIMLVLAVGSGAAEYALSVGGIGLSGVGYGFVGLLWVLSRRDIRFRDAFDSRVLYLFIAWGFLCVALTYADILPVGNIAHASGFVLGVLIGHVLAPSGAVRRALAAVALVALVGGGLAGAALYRPEINFNASEAALDDAYAGSAALGEQQYELAARLLRRSLALDGDRAKTWYNYGVALQYVGDPSGLTPADAWLRAFSLDPLDEQIREAMLQSVMRD